MRFLSGTAFGEYHPFLKHTLAGWKYSKLTLRYGDPFLAQIRMLSQTKVTEEQSWHTSLIFEALEKKKEPQPAHILIVTNHEDFGSEDHLLLEDLAAPRSSDLQPTASAGIRAHVFVPGVYNVTCPGTYLLLVADEQCNQALMLSLFGPRHARLLQLHFDPSRKLNVRASKRYDFTRTKEAPWDIFYGS